MSACRRHSLFAPCEYNLPHIACISLTPTTSPPRSLAPGNAVYSNFVLQQCCERDLLELRTPLAEQTTASRPLLLTSEEYAAALGYANAARSPRNSAARLRGSYVESRGCLLGHCRRHSATRNSDGSFSLERRG